MQTPTDSRSSRLYSDLDPELVLSLAEDSKLFKDIRDRAAYLYLTGTFPTHLRAAFTRVLRALSRVVSLHVGNQRLTKLALEERAARKLALDDHPMVVKVRSLLRQGWRIHLTRDETERRPYSKIFLSKGNRRITVQIDGSVKEGW